MKKAILPLLIALLWISTASAQSERGMKFGFQVSPGVSWFNPDMKKVGSSPRLSFSFGAMADIPLMNNIALSTGLGGNFVGGTMKFDDPVVPVLDTTGRGIDNNLYLGEATYKLRYVKIPLTFKGMTNQIGHLRYFIEFGGSMGFNYLARMDIDGEDLGDHRISQEEEKDYPIKRMVRTFRFNMLIRAGAEYNISGSTNLIFGLTYDNGLTNTFNPNNIPTFQNTDNNNVLPDIDDKNKPISGGDMSAIVNDIKINVGVLF
jgi:hypothetical protein